MLTSTDVPAPEARVYGPGGRSLYVTVDSTGIWLSDYNGETYQKSVFVKYGPYDDPVSKKPKERGTWVRKMSPHGVPIIVVED